MTKSHKYTTSLNAVKPFLKKIMKADRERHVGVGIRGITKGTARIVPFYKMVFAVTMVETKYPLPSRAGRSNAI
jgi:hypothetical protein